MDRKMVAHVFKPRTCISLFLRKRLQTHWTLPGGMIDSWSSYWGSLREAERDMGSRVAALRYQAQVPGTELRVHCGLPVRMSSAPHQLEAPAVSCRGLGSAPTGREVSLEYSYIPEPSALVPAGLLGPPGMCPSLPSTTNTAI